jgi:hypothetical protein
MSAINTGRVIAGGVGAAVTMTAVNFASSVVLKDEMTAMVDRLRLEPAVMEPSHVVPWIIVNLLYGILIVLNYAAMRPRFGPGPKTALLAGLILFAAVTAILYGFMTMGVFTEAHFLKSSAFYAVSTALGSLVGGWIYKES